MADTHAPAAPAPAQAGDAHVHAIQLDVQRVCQPRLLQLRDGAEVRRLKPYCGLNARAELLTHCSIDNDAYGTVDPYPGFSSRCVRSWRASARARARLLSQFWTGGCRVTGADASHKLWVAGRLSPRPEIIPYAPDRGYARVGKLVASPCTPHRR